MNTDRVVTAVVCSLVGIAGGFIAWTASLAIYLVGALLLGAHISEAFPVLALRVALPAGGLTGLIIGMVCD